MIRIHSLLVNETGEPEGIRDYGLLKSAIYAPQVTWGGEYLNRTIYDQAAAYLYHIACDHAFEQGNKRTAFAVMVTFLNKNDYDIEITIEEAEELVIQVVTHQISKEELSIRLEKLITTLI